MYGFDQLAEDISAYFGGGDCRATVTRHFKGGGSNAAVNYQKQADAEQKAKIAAATSAINSIFDNANREAQYQQQRDAVYQLNANDVNRQAEEAERANRFALARSGLLGGSAEIDSTADINERTNKGLLKAQGLADDSAAQLKTQDESTRQNLLSLANSGIDANSAATMATNQLAGNLDSAASDKATAAVGNLFNDMAQAYLNGTVASALNSQLAQQRALYNQNYGVSDTHSTYSGS